MRSHPAELAALATMPLQNPAAAAAELERATREGLAGAHVYSNIGGRYLDDEDFDLIFETAAAVRAPISLHPTVAPTMAPFAVHALVPAVGFVVDSTLAVLRLTLAGVERHPALEVVVAHAGGVVPYVAARVDYESARTHELGALSSPPSETLPRLRTDAVCGSFSSLRMAVEFFGAGGVMFGTDGPHWDPAVTLDALVSSQLPPAIDEAVRWQNAAALYGLSGLGPKTKP